MLLDHLTVDLALKTVVAILLGGAIGWQREMVNKPAGFRTHILIVLGSTALMETSVFAARAFGGDPTRLASNVIVGIGFIGAGTIMKEGPTVYGLTSAATIWVAGALGLAIGAGYYGVSIILTVSTLVILVAFGRIESAILMKRSVRRYEIIARDGERMIPRVQQALAKQPHRRSGLDLRREAGRVHLTFEIADGTEEQESLFDDLRRLEEVLEIRTS